MKKQKNYNCILLCLVIIQFFLIVYVNLIHTVDMLDYDSALAFRHSVEIWKNGLFLEDFNYFSTLEIDNAAFFAAPLYILTGHLSTSMTVSHIIFYLAIAFVLGDIFKKINANKSKYLIALLLIFTPYTFGQLEWANMLFLMVGQYEFRVIVLLLTIDIVLRADQNDRSVKSVVLNIIYSIFVFWTSLSCGNYVLFIELSPFILYVFIRDLKQHDFKQNMYTKVLLLFNIIISFAGWRIHNHFAGASFRNTVNLIPAGELMNNIWNTITGVFLLFGGTTFFDSVSLFSREGICIVLRFILVLFWFFTVVNRLRKNQYSVLFSQFLAIAFVNIFVFVIANLRYGSSIFEYRYHIIWCVPLLLCVAETKEYFSDPWFNKLAQVCLVVILVIVNYDGFSKLNKQVGFDDICYAVMSEANEQDAESIFLYDHPIEAHVMKALDTDIFCTSARLSDNGSMQLDIDDFYFEAAENGYASDRNILVCTQEEFSNLPSYITSSYRHTSDLYNGWSVYYSDHNPWDGRSGLPVASSNKSKDFPYSPGFSSSNNFNDNGDLVISDADKGFVLRGPYTSTVKGTYDITLHYDLKSAGKSMPYFSISVNNGAETFGKIYLSPDQNSITLENISIPDGQVMELRVWVPAGTTMTVVSIDYERVQAQ